jgi:hypothetical protein
LPGTQSLGNSARPRRVERTRVLLLDDGENGARIGGPELPRPVESRAEQIDHAVAEVRETRAATHGEWKDGHRGR